MCPCNITYQNHENQNQFLLNGLDFRPSPEILKRYRLFGAHVFIRYYIFSWV